MVNIGVGPSNAKTITDHIAVLRPHAWLMLGHCAGLRNTQALGDYVLAHAYVREDHVLDDDLPVWVPIPPLAEVQVALEEAVAEVTGLSGYDLKRIMRTGTVATIDNRNWELRDQRGPVQRLSQSRAIALDMESATIAANGFRFRVPYGTLLCVSDKPLHGELKLPGMATEFYKRQVAQHLTIGIRAMEKLAEMPDGAAAFAQAAQLLGDGVPVKVRRPAATSSMGRNSCHIKLGMTTLRTFGKIACFAAMMLALGSAGRRLLRRLASGARFVRPFQGASGGADDAGGAAAAGDVACACRPWRRCCSARRHWRRRRHR